MAIPPQMLISLANAFKSKKEQDDKIGRGLIDKTKNTVISGAGIAGNILQATSDMPGQEPNVGQSAFGGALSGLSAGMAFGPFGALLGAAVGGLGGYASGSKNLEEHLKGLNEEQDMNMLSKTLQPTMYEDGGEVVQASVQTEAGEIILLPATLELVKAAAKKDHDDMDEDFVSDVLPEGAEVFSKRLTFDPKKFEELIIGRGQGHYTEKETFAPEEVEVGDMFGDKEISYADAADKLRKKIKVVGKETKDIFDNITDEENKLTRSMYLSVLMESQAEDRAKEESKEGATPVPMFKYGGRVKKYPDGGTVGKGVSANYYGNVLKKLEELRGKNENTLKTGKEELSDLTKRMRGSVMAQAGVETLFTALQDPRVDPVVQDTTFINEAYQQMPLSFIESQVAPIRGSVNSMAQALLSSGVDPKDVPSMVAGTQGRALDVEGRMRSNFALDRVNTDRGKYGALRENLTSNRANVIGAGNEERANYNQRFANFGSIIANSIGSNREISAGEVEARRGLEKAYNANDISLFQTETNIEGNRMEFDDNMRRINERLDALNLERIRMGRDIDSRSGLYNTPQLKRIPPGQISSQNPSIRITENGVENVPSPSPRLRRPIAPLDNNRRIPLPGAMSSSGNIGSISSLPMRQRRVESLFSQDPMQSILSSLEVPQNSNDWYMNTQSTYW